MNLHSGRTILVYARRVEIVAFLGQSLLFGVELRSPGGYSPELTSGVGSSDAEILSMKQLTGWGASSSCTMWLLIMRPNQTSKLGTDLERTRSSSLR
jgi:hypothetical protein